MQAINTKELELADISSPADETREVRAAFPVHWQSGAAATAMVYFELEPGMHLGSHTDSAEEVLVVLEGEVEATVGAERARLDAGDLAVVPAMEPHDVRNVGDTKARVAGIFGANATVAVFEEEFSVMGMEPTRVNGTPPPVIEPPAHGRVRDGRARILSSPSPVGVPGDGLDRCDEAQRVRDYGHLFDEFDPATREPAQTPLVERKPPTAGSPRAGTRGPKPRPRPGHSGP